MYEIHAIIKHEIHVIIKHEIHGIHEFNYESQHAVNTLFRFLVFQTLAMKSVLMVDHCLPHKR